MTETRTTNRVSNVFYTIFPSDYEKKRNFFAHFPDDDELIFLELFVVSFVRNAHLQ